MTYAALRDYERFCVPGIRFLCRDLPYRAVLKLEIIKKLNDKKNIKRSR